MQEKIAAFRKKLAIPPENLLNVIRTSTQVFHDIAVKRMDVTGNSMPRVRVRELPSKDMVFLSILFGYDYNHIEYERNFNLLYPWTVEKVVEYVGHEMEPGHLTYFEKRLQTMIDTCWPEMSIVSQFSTSNAFGEGSARHAISMSFDNSVEKQTDFEREIIFKNAGIDTRLAALMPPVAQVLRDRGATASWRPPETSGTASGPGRRQGSSWRSTRSRRRARALSPWTIWRRTTATLWPTTTRGTW